MKRKIETSLRRAMDQLPQPDYWTVAEAPVQKMEVHDYVTRQDVPVRPVRRRAPLGPGRLRAGACCGTLFLFSVFPDLFRGRSDGKPSFALDAQPGTRCGT